MSTLEHLTLPVIWRQPLPFQAERPLTRGLCRLMARISRRYVVEIQGLEHVSSARDPFLLVANHSQRLEAVLMPALLAYLRQGKMIRFLADWNFMLVPFVALLYRRSGVIPITHKNARPRILNRLRPLFQHPQPPLRRALAALEAGESVGIFPEGTVNRQSDRLLPGRTGAAWLALASGAPVIPLGIRFPDWTEPGTSIPDGARMTFHIGPGITPPPRPTRGRLPPPTLRAFHEVIMRALARASAKTWSPPSQLERRTHGEAQRHHGSDRQGRRHARAGARRAPHRLPRRETMDPGRTVAGPSRGSRVG